MAAIVAAREDGAGVPAVIAGTTTVTARRLQHGLAQGAVTTKHVKQDPVRGHEEHRSRDAPLCASLAHRLRRPGASACGGGYDGTPPSSAAAAAPNDDNNNVSVDAFADVNPIDPPA